MERIRAHQCDQRSHHAATVIAGATQHQEDCGEQRNDSDTESRDPCRGAAVHAQAPHQHDGDTEERPEERAGCTAEECDPEPKLHPIACQDARSSGHTPARFRRSKTLLPLQSPGRRGQVADAEPRRDCVKSAEKSRSGLRAAWWYEAQNTTYASSCTSRAMLIERSEGSRRSWPYE